MDGHLTGSQIDQLLRFAARREEEPGTHRVQDERARIHLKACEICQSKLRAEENLMERLALLKHDGMKARGPECPVGDVWLEVAAGISQDSETYLPHAAQCGHCGPLLHQAVADLADEPTAEEEVHIADLPGSSPERQREIAASLGRSAAARGPESPRRTWKLFRPVTHWPAGVAFAIVLACLIGGAVWLPLHWRARELPGHLIAHAYAEKRTLEVRIEGAPYAALRQERGIDAAQGRMTRPALLEAETKIARQLQSHPDDVPWLQASGRASLLENDPQSAEAAVAVLQKAERMAPNDQSVSIDLASAYMLRGQFSDRPEDFGSAVEILGKVLALHPENEVAQFNDAIALEKLLLKGQAVQAWQGFLKNHPKSPWANEAQGRLTRLQQEIRERDQRGEKALKSLGEVAAVFRAQREAEIAGIDAQVEEYQERALQSWLPAYFASPDPQAAESQTLKAALFGLAALLETRHGDRWLADMVSADRRAGMKQAVLLLSHSDTLAQTSDDGPIEREAAEASRLFRRAGFSAGELRSQFELSLIEQFQHRKRPCETAALALLKNLADKQYVWIAIQGQLEAAICADMSDDHALRALHTGRALALAHRYPILAMRAAMFESEMFWALGDEHRAWLVSTKGLKTFWFGSYPRLRGYNFLVSLDDLVAQQHSRFLEVAILKEAVPMIDTEPRRAMAAFEHARLGQMQLESGDIDGAESSFRKTQQLFGELSPGLRRNALSAEAELGLAKVELERGDSTAASKRLEKIQPVMTDLPDDRLALDYLQTIGIARLRAGQLEEARRDLHAAIRLAEKGLGLVSSDDDRWQWSHRNEPSYRAMVELELHTDPRLALAYWEWYRAASLRTRQAKTAAGDSSHTSGQVWPNASLAGSGFNPGTALISYYMAPAGVFVWVADNGGVREQFLSVPESLLEAQIEQFVEHCSNPNSNLREIHREGAELYRELLQPIELWIAQHTQIIIEPDGGLRKLPFEVLVDSHGSYLVDRFAVAVSPGLSYLNSGRRWTGISSASRALVVGDPEAQGWNSLPDAEQEARAVASLFAGARLLVNTEISSVELDQAISQSEVFHFSGHATATVRSAGLIINGNGSAYQPQGLGCAHCQLVVLSACESSRGTTGLFDDEDSLVRRLMAAKVPEVIASRWAVDSTATGELMTGFYSHLLAGQGVASSLADAARSVRAEPRFTHPYYWAAFSAFGRN